MSGTRTGRQQFASACTFASAKLDLPISLRFSRAFVPKLGSK